MTFSDIQKEKVIELLRKDADKRKKQREYMNEYRRKERENGIKQKSVIAKNNKENVKNYYHKTNAILALKYLFKIV